MLEIGGERIFVADSGGDLPALLFVHGTMMDGTVWDKQVAAFEARYRDLAARARQDVTINDYVTTDERSQIGLLAQITLPTTIIGGDGDLVCKPGASTYMAEHIPGCTDGVHVITGAGHAPFLTRPDEFDAILAGALEAHDHACG